MNHEQDERERKVAGLPAHPQRAATVASVASGAVTGALIGFFAGAGAIGVVVGGALGAAAGGGVGKYVRERSKRERAHDEVLDREIGVMGGDIGAAPPTDQARPT